MFGFLKNKKEPAKTSKFIDCGECNNKLNELRDLKIRQKDLIDNPRDIVYLLKHYFPEMYPINEPWRNLHYRMEYERMLREIIGKIDNMDEFIDMINEVKDYQDDIKCVDSKIAKLMEELEIR